MTATSNAAEIPAQPVPRPLPGLLHRVSPNAIQPPLFSLLADENDVIIFEYQATKIIPGVRSWKHLLRAEMTFP